MTAGLFDRLTAHAATRPERIALRFLENGERETQTLTYRALAAEITRLASVLAAHALAGRPVILALPPGTAFVTALLAVMRAGGIAVPVPFPPLGEGRARFRAIVATLGKAVILTTDAASVLAQDPSATARLLDLTTFRHTSGFVPDMPEPSAPAVLQFSSGSTAEPRGIVVTHGNIATNAAMIEDAFGLAPSSICVHWLPPHHDMGLFGAILAPLRSGAQAVLMPAFSFLQKPVRWLRAISTYRGTIAGGPNFCYELCLRRIKEDDLATLDLSCLKVAYCGAEPIRPASLDAFAARIAQAGFRAEALMPCYGLAEATLLVSGTAGLGLRTVPVETLTGATQRAVCGAAPPGCTITIRDPESGVNLPMGKTGEICVEGAHVAAGEWDPNTNAMGPLSSAGITADGARILRTGDLGILVPEGLVILDRIKDLICVHGRNIHAIDVEMAAIEAGGGAIVAAAAFAVEEDGRERLVLLCEVPMLERAGLTASFESRLATAIGEGSGVRPTIALLRHGALPRTTSGKIRRQAARQRFLQGLIHPLVLEVDHA